MDLTALTRDNLDDFLRREAGVDVLGGRAPATRLVLFDRRRAVLTAVGRPRRRDEAWDEPVVELAYLARVLRPRALALSFPFRPEPGASAPRFELRRLLVERVVGGCRMDHREHPFVVTEEGLLVWDAPRRSPAPAALNVLARVAMRRSRHQRRRHLDVVVGLLVADGHQVEVAPRLLDRPGAPIH